MLLQHRPPRAIPPIDMADDSSVFHLHLALTGNDNARIPGEGRCPGQGPGCCDSIVKLINVMEIEGGIPKPVGHQINHRSIAIESRK